MDCTSSCKLKKHADCLVSAVSKENLQHLKSYIKDKCSNACYISDSYGRNLVHVAASYGRLDVLQWIFEELNISPNILKVKDKESGWTALHKAIYFGNITCAVYLTKILTEWKSLDHEGHTYLDLTFLDSHELNKNRKSKQIYQVIAQYEASEAGELNLNIGDRLEIFRKYRNGWGDGRILNSNMKGLLPLSFIEEVIEDLSIEKPSPVITCNDLYMWGLNTNYTLGLADGSNRIHPEHLEIFKSNKLTIEKVVLTKFHSVFLTKDGLVFTCGLGLGGRLGHGNEEVLFEPKIVSFFKHAILNITGGSNHTMVVDELGKVYSFGLNDMHQLGHYTPPKKLLLPQLISSKSLKTKFFIGIAAARFHSVIHTDCEVYTFGLNAGQLGHSKGEELQTAPKLVSHLFKQESKIESVKASDGATLVLMKNGDLFLLQDFVCRKIALKMNEVKKICIVGGKLESKLIEFNKPEPLKIVVLYKSGMVNLWKHGYRNFKKVYWHNQNSLNSTFIDISLGRDLLLVSSSGLCYIGHVSNKAFPKESASDSKTLFVSSNKVEVIDKIYTVAELVAQSKDNRASCEEIYLEKVPLLYHAEKCFTDQKNRVFAVVQRDPIFGLQFYPTVCSSSFNNDLQKFRESSSVDDNVCDLVIEVKDGKIPCHKFVIFSRIGEGNIHVKKGKDSVDCLDFSELNANDLNKKWIDEIYSKETNTIPKHPSRNLMLPKNDVFSNGDHDEDIDFANKMSLLIDSNFDDPTDDFAENVFDFGNSNHRRKSAYRVHKEQKKLKKDNYTPKRTSRNVGNVVEMQSFAKWRQQEQLSDVLIESSDGEIFHCHKCILIARLEYFRNMLDNIWIESTIYKSQPLKMCFPAKILNVLLHYLYTDTIPSVQSCDDISFLGEVIVCADQVLAKRMKDMCESELAKKVSLKNAVEMLEFGYHYNSQQIQKFTCEFITGNLPYFLEARLLEDLSDDLLQILTSFYKTNTIGMNERALKPSSYHEESDKKDRDFSQKVRAELSQWRKRSRTLSSMSDTSETLDTSFSEVTDDAVFHKDEKLDDIKSVSVTPKFVNNTSPKVVDNMSPKIVNNMSPKMVSNTLPKMVNNTSPKMVNNASPKFVNKISPMNLAASTKTLKTKAEEQKNCQSQIPLQGIPQHTSPNKMTFKKMSQKERKKLQMAKVTEQQTESSVSGVIQEENERKSKTWNLSESQMTLTPSFRELLMEEEERSGNEVVKKKTAMKASTVRGNVSRGETNPWSKKIVAGGNQVANHLRGFSNIMKTQQEEKQERIKQQQKPLSTIQLEERAIEEIKSYYKKHFHLDQGVEIIVQRKRTISEMPVWSRDVT